MVDAIASKVISYYWNVGSNPTKNSYNMNNYYSKPVNYRKLEKIWHVPKRKFSKSPIKRKNLTVVLQLYYNGKFIKISRTPDWEINMTQVAKLFGRRWSDWSRWNQETINTFESLEGKPLVRKEGSKNRLQTYVAINLALRILSDYDNVLSWNVFTQYEKSLRNENCEIALELKRSYEKNDLLKATIAKLKNESMNIDLIGGEFLLYGYGCNNKVKFGTSFCNVNGQRPKSHKNSVPNLAIGFVVYASKSVLQKTNKAIKDRFRIIGKLEHIDCTIDELENFVIQYLNTMNFEYQKEDILKLKLFNIFLKN